MDPRSGQELAFLSRKYRGRPFGAPQASESQEGTTEAKEEVSVPITFPVVRFFLDTEFVEYPGVVDLISVGIVSEDGREFYAESSEFDESKASEWVQQNVLPKLLRTNPVTREEMAKAIDAYIGFCVPQFWADHCAYDWVAFAQVFGTMVQLPERFPKYCFDLKVEEVILGLDKSMYPKQDPDTEHNALDDARHLRSQFLAVKDKLRLP